jgi:hypothetical protein
MNQTMKSLLPFVLLSFSLFLMQCTSKENQTIVATEDTTRYEAGIVEPEKVDLKGDFNGRATVNKRRRNTIYSVDLHPRVFRPCHTVIHF